MTSAVQGSREPASGTGLIVAMPARGDMVVALLGG
jgi:hypothetical protein